MDGYIYDSESNYLSEITIDSLKDLGYETIEFGESYTQLISEIAQGIYQENDFAKNILLAASQNEEDFAKIDTIL